MKRPRWMAGALVLGDEWEIEAARVALDQYVANDIEPEEMTPRQHALHEAAVRLRDHLDRRIAELAELQEPTGGRRI